MPWVRAEAWGRSTGQSYGPEFGPGSGRSIWTNPHCLSPQTSHLIETSIARHLKRGRFKRVRTTYTIFIRVRTTILYYYNAPTLSPGKPAHRSLDGAPPQACPPRAAARGAAAAAAGSERWLAPLFARFGGLYCCLFKLTTPRANLPLTPDPPPTHTPFTPSAHTSQTVEKLSVDSWRLSSLAVHTLCTPPLTPCAHIHSPHVHTPIRTHSHPVHTSLRRWRYSHWRAGE